MPFLDIAIAHSSVQKHLGCTRVHLFINSNIPNYSLLQHEERWAWFRKSVQNSKNLKFGFVHFKKSCPGFLVRAVATLEPKYLVQIKDSAVESNALSSTAEAVSKVVQPESSNDDSEEIEERERLRRLRISKANSGNTPWNKGRKHSPETLQRIKERTRLAMQSPKVRMKLAMMGHAQSPETREKIAIGVRMGWQKRREMLRLQETCLFDWQNLIAEAARGGFKDEVELQWDSYNILSMQLQQEWLDSIEARKLVPKPKGSKRAPKSDEQRRKIAEAIAAKWADPEYRSRVCSGLAKYHGIPEGGERKARKKKQSGEDSSNTTNRKRSEKERSAENRRSLQPKLKKRNVPKYKDPLAMTKLEMLKNIRAQRVASDPMKIQALERAKLLIAEARKAAKALEVAAMRSPVARASLIEAQKLIAEATQSIESIENGELSSQDDVRSGHHDSIGINDIKETVTANVDQRYPKIVNGMGKIPTEQRRRKWLNGVESLQLSAVDEVDPKHHLPTKLGVSESFAENKRDLNRNGSIKLNGMSSVNGAKLQSHEEEDAENSAAKRVTKKWVRGRLVEVVESE
ncbi:hypothetical protein RND81_04G135300 [Saponaria officinalis]|uniref:Nuclease associated modular domain-containing protein n=1 Tax=Saponaria officinalis TaxID=3572 RepID=A0AAW1LJ43_SAPOF